MSRLWDYYKATKALAPFIAFAVIGQVMSNSGIAILLILLPKHWLMNIKPKMLTPIALTVLLSCSSKKLDLKTTENDKILIENYRVSEITTIHQFIDVKNKRWNKTERILEANDGTIDSVFIKQDTLFLVESSNSVIYDLAAVKFGYKIVVLHPVK